MRTSAVMMPPGRPLAEEFELTGDEVGSGMSGSVVLARTRVSAPEGEGEAPLVAVKTLSKEGLSDEAALEANTFLHMDHPNIARLLRVCEDSRHVHLVMEYCSGGPLARRLEQLGGHFPEAEAADVVCQVLSAVNYCHKHPSGKVCHRDIKLSNILYASEAPGAPVKLIDFGLSSVISPHRPRLMSGRNGTVGFMAPEVLTARAYDESCDMWSIGVLSYILLCGRSPFDRSSYEAYKREVIESGPMEMVGQEWDDVSQSAKDFVRQLLQQDPQRRPTAEAALQLDWVAASRAGSGSALPGGQLPVSPGSGGDGLLGAFRTFAKESPMRRAVANFMVCSRGVPPEEAAAASWEAQFRAIDTDLDGSISEEELAKAFETTFPGTPEEEARAIFRRLDVNGDAAIQWSECLAATTGARLLGREDAIVEAFSRFDGNEDGVIELPELERILGASCCGRSTREIFEECDANGDKSIDLNEFYVAVGGGEARPNLLQEISDRRRRPPQNTGKEYLGEGKART